MHKFDTVLSLNYENQHVSLLSQINGQSLLVFEDCRLKDEGLIREGPKREEGLFQISAQRWAH